MNIKDVEAIYGLSPLQEALLPRDGAACAGFEQCYRALPRDPFDAGAFHRAWQQVCAAHPELRTTFAWKMLDKPVQVVRKRGLTAPEEEDWQALPCDRRDETLTALLRAEQSRACDPSKPTLLRLFVCHTADDSRLLVISYHPLLLDAQSAAHVVEEVVDCYERLLDKQEAAPERARPFSDYINWLKEYDWSRTETFWRQHLEGDPPATLPLARAAQFDPSTAVPSEAERVLVSAETTGRLRAFAREHELTLEVLLQGLWAVLLSRYGGEDDVLFAITVSNRPAELAAEAMLGPLTATLPTRVKVAATAHLAPWLRELQTQLNALRQHGHATRTQISAWSGLSGGSLSPATAITVSERHAAASESHGLRFAARPKAPLDVSVTLDSELELQATYARDMFDGHTVKAMLAHYARLLAEVAHDPRRQLHALPLITDDEHYTLLVSRNETRADYDERASVVTLFERQAERKPEAVALLFEGEAMSYAGLNRRANQLAHYLRGMGVGPETHVGLLLERSTEMIVGLLGVLKAGGAYVPLDPASPAERLQFMLEDCQASILLTQERLLDTLPTSWAQVICLDAEWPAIEGESEDNPGVETCDATPAYVIYTSGSTGTPKGVLVEHQKLTSRIQGMQNLYGLTEGDRHLQFVPFTFDVAVEEIFVTLTSGAALVLHRNPFDLMPSDLLLECARLGVTKWNMTASYWHTLVDDIVRSEQRVPECFRWLVVGGESPSTEKLRAFAGRVHHPLRLLNAYGPTEASIMSTGFEMPLEAERIADLSRVPIGGPLANTRVYILNAQLQPLPAGAVGELYIGGSGVARGYLNRPALTAERFLPDPFSGETGARLYRTGDLVRYLPDGNIEFIGRADGQVKVRGFRIELGEIEAALLRHAGVRECVVAARDDDTGGKRLVAYVVGHAETGSALATPALREHLRDTLPDYMIPSLFVLLDALPLTPNGKVDRRALPAPSEAATTTDSTRTYEPPQTPAELTLAHIWSDLLGVARISRSDNFFNLGGDSILSIQVVARAAEAGWRLSPKLLFRHQTLSALAAAATAALPTATAALAEQGEVAGEAPLTPIQRWFFSRGLRYEQHYNQAVLLRPRRELRAEWMAQALAAVVRQHDALRFRYWRDEQGGWRQEHVAADEVTAARLLRVVAVRGDGESEGEREREVEAEAERVQRGFQLDHAPLIRAVLFEAAGDSDGEAAGGGGGAAAEGGGQRWQRVLVVMHHLVTDGVTWRVVLDDWRRAYEQLERGTEVRLPAKTCSFKRWAELTVGRAELTSVEEGAYWAGRARIKAVQLPRDVRGGGNVEGSARHVERVLSVAETVVLLREVPGGARGEIGEVLLAGVVAAVWGWAGAKVGAVRVEVEGHGRTARSVGAEEDEGEGEECGVERTAGWFTAAYPLVVEVSGVGATDGQVAGGQVAGGQVAGGQGARGQGARGVGGEADEALRWVRRVREAGAGVSGGGAGYGLVRYVSDGEVGRELEQAEAEGGVAEVSFNYLGQFDQSFDENSLFDFAPESSGAAQSPEEKRSHLLNITAVVAGKQFRVDWSYSEEVHHAATIERLADRYVEFLKTLIEHSASHSTQAGASAEQFGDAVDREQVKQLLGAGARVEDVYPLTPMQKGILFQSLYAARSEMYFNQISCTLRGELDVEAFRRAWRQVVEQHPVLRTSFVWHGLDEEVQVVSQGVDISWEEEDWSGVSEAELPHRLDELLAAQQRRGFLLSRPPLVRFVLLRLGARAHRFVWCWHHLLLDGWSLPLLLGEVFALYAGREASSLEPRRPYRDFVAWLQTHARGGAREAAEAYWREALRGFTSPTPLRALESRGSTTGGTREDNGRGARVAEVVTHMGEAESTALSRQAGRRGLTLNAATQAAWALALMRVSGTEDVVFGAVVSGRGGGLAGVERMLGLFINTLPVRARVRRWEAGAWEWVRSLQEEQAEAREHEQSGLVEVQGWSEVARSAHLFESLLAFENYPVDNSVGETSLGLEIEDIKTSTQTNYPLTMTVIPGACVVLRLAYDVNRFDESAVAALVADFGAALRLFATTADATLGELNELLDADQRQRRVAAEEGLKQARGLKFRTVRREVVTNEAVRVADSGADD